jgi:ESCRT-II complex subunit VPS22
LTTGRGKLYTLFKVAARKVRGQRRNLAPVLWSHGGSFLRSGLYPMLPSNCQADAPPHISVQEHRSALMSSRRGVGLGAFTNRATTAQSYAQHGSSLKTANAASLQTQLEVFQSLLHNFAIEHSATIKSNPTFRAEFARMCNAIGVDPLAGSYSKGKGGKADSLWAKVLGHDVNDFYFSIALRVVELCQATRGENGGLLGVKECAETVARGKAIGGGMEVSEDDVARAVKSLGPLGSGFTIIPIAGKQFIRSVPKELNTDQATVLEVLQLLGSVSVSLLRANLNWDKARAVTVLEDLLADSLVWVDYQCREPEYWSPQGLIDDD